MDCKDHDQDTAFHLKRLLSLIQHYGQGHTEFTTELHRFYKGLQPETRNFSFNSYSKFVVVEPIISLNLLKRIFLEMFPAMLTSHIVINDRFHTIYPYMVDKDYFYPFFNWGVARIYESGLFTRWDAWFQRVDDKNVLKCINKEIRSRHKDSEENLHSQYTHGASRILTASKLEMIWLICICALFCIFLAFLTEYRMVFECFKNVVI